ncbi:ParA family protein [Haliovirga abyssi]|uniref:Sporulation initiation inhibitor Soj n=1 Tax=Haliovirga abyssi TaxID=2996794 RepID=A0AAU9DK95_9FUSO|nr:AAA family ATPase [Haliovirga abyssi]BDU50307.1 sporulation initiation inhibitor Soj [Haliovirga abyssi]
MKVISILNQKGGVGKTTTTVNLSSYLAKMGKRVLLVDMDPQGNATTGIGIDKSELENSIYNLILDDVAIKKIIINRKENLDVLPAKIDLAGAEIELVGKISRETRLKKKLDEIKNEYDVVLIDCPPSLGLLTLNALTASNDIIIPIQCEFYALEGLSQLLNTINLIKKELNPELNIAKILLTMYDKRLKLSEEVSNEIRTYFKEKVFENVIPRNIKLTEAPSYGKTIDEYDMNSNGAKAYYEIAKEVINSGII